MKSITNHEADEWIARMTPEQIRQMIQEHHTLKQGLCYQVLLVATGEDDWVDRAIAAGRRVKKCETELRVLLNTVENACVEARDRARETTCTNCMGKGVLGKDRGTCCVCHGTGARALI